MRDKSNVTGMLAITVRFAGPDAEAIRKAAAMFGKSPDQYCAEYLKWCGRMDAEGAA